MITRNPHLYTLYEDSGEKFTTMGRRRKRPKWVKSSVRSMSLQEAREYWKSALLSDRYRLMKV